MSEWHACILVRQGLPDSATVRFHNHLAFQVKVLWWNAVDTPSSLICSVWIRLPLLLTTLFGDTLACKMSSSANADLETKHAREREFLEQQIRQYSKPKLGRKAPSPQEVKDFADSKRSELAAKQAEELKQLLEALANGCPPDVAPQSPAKSRQEPLLSATPPSTPAQAEEGAAATPASGETGTPSSSKLSRKQRRAIAAQQEEEVEEAAASATRGTPGRGRDLKGEELAALNKALAPLAMIVSPVPADGNCMFSAVADQLSSSSRHDGGYTMQGLRKRAADYIRAHALEFAPFLPYEDEDGYTGQEGEAARLCVQRYADRLEHSACWGGHPELRALACTLGIPIIVYQAEGEPSVFRPDGTETLAGQGRESALRLTYHRHYLTAGEHYNSVRMSHVMMR